MGSERTIPTCINGFTFLYGQKNRRQWGRDRVKSVCVSLWAQSVLFCLCVREITQLSLLLLRCRILSEKFAGYVPASFLFTQEDVYASLLFLVPVLMFWFCQERFDLLFCCLFLCKTFLKKDLVFEFVLFPAMLTQIFHLLNKRTVLFAAKLNI